jgi:hypothetical protein
VRVEGEDAHRERARRSDRTCVGEHTDVSAMDAIEVSDHDDAR